MTEFAVYIFYISGEIYVLASDYPSPTARRGKVYRIIDPRRFKYTDFTQENKIDTSKFDITCDHVNVLLYFT